MLIPTPFLLIAIRLKFTQKYDQEAFNLGLSITL